MVLKLPFSFIFIRMPFVIAIVLPPFILKVIFSVTCCFTKKRFLGHPVCRVRSYFDVVDSWYFCGENSWNLNNWADISWFLSKFKIQDSREIRIRWKIYLSKWEGNCAIYSTLLTVHDININRQIQNKLNNSQYLGMWFLYSFGLTVALVILDFIWPGTPLFPHVGTQ